MYINNAIDSLSTQNTAVHFCTYNSISRHHKLWSEFWIKRKTIAPCLVRYLFQFALIFETKNSVLTIAMYNLTMNDETWSALVLWPTCSNRISTWWLHWKTSNNGYSLYLLHAKRAVVNLRGLGSHPMRLCLKLQVENPLTRKVTGSVTGSVETGNRVGWNARPLALSANGDSFTGFMHSLLPQSPRVISQRSNLT